MNPGGMSELLNSMHKSWPTLFLHSANVANLVSKIGHSLPFTKADRETAIIGALLHDVGKMFIRREIIDKPGPLTENEWGEIKKHPWLGAFEVAEKGGSPALVDMIRYHHERWDGTGYEGLRGKEIPCCAQIIALADALDAMLSSRPYREPVKMEDALKEVYQGSGFQFNPQLLAVLAQESSWQTATYSDPTRLAKQIGEEKRLLAQLPGRHGSLAHPLVYAQTKWLDRLVLQLQHKQLLGADRQNSF